MDNDGHERGKDDNGSNEDGDPFIDGLDDNLRMEDNVDDGDFIGL